MTAMERIHVDHRGNKMCIHTNHIREYQSQSWKSFSSLRTFQDVLFKTGAGCKRTLQRQSILKNHNSTSRDQIKNQGTALFPEFTNQSAANQSNGPLFPHRLRSRIYVLTVTLRKLFLVFQTRGGIFSYVRGYNLTQDSACCLRLQPHLYPSMVVTGLGRGDELRHSRRE